MRSFESYFPCGAVYYAVQVVLTFESVDEIIQCNIRLKGIEPDFPAVRFTMQGDSNF